MDIGRKAFIYIVLYSIVLYSIMPPCEKESHAQCAGIRGWDGMDQSASSWSLEYSCIPCFTHESCLYLPTRQLLFLICDSKMSLFSRTSNIHGYFTEFLASVLSPKQPCNTGFAERCWLPKGSQLKSVANSQGFEFQCPNPANKSFYLICSLRSVASISRLKWIGRQIVQQVMYLICTICKCVHYAK